MSLRDLASKAVMILEDGEIFTPEWKEEADKLANALRAALAEPRPEIEQLKAERDALKAAAEKGTEYVLAHINQDLRAERDALLAEVERLKGVNYDSCAGEKEMTRDDIIRMAMEIGGIDEPEPDSPSVAFLERFAALVAAAERRECAIACEGVEQITESQSWVVANCVETILDRGRK